MGLPIKNSSFILKLRRRVEGFSSSLLSRAAEYSCIEYLPAGSLYAANREDTLFHYILHKEGSTTCREQDSKENSNKEDKMVFS
ncbi:hypothetical protein WKV44_03855 [Spirochaetia bacterium 38H-sp]|uniref:Uncharacterized protein n=1 Tax=Rarispira pelagica TaxID=3141764 RepID=A0ABU9UAJ4_9SPIR